MAAFSATSFDTSAFSIGAFDFSSSPPTPPVDIGITPLVGGGIPARSRLTLRDGRTKEEIRRDRERFGIIPPAVVEVIAAVAARQAETLVLDEQKRYEELTREITLLGLEYDARYLEAVNIERQRLIDAEIGMLLRRRQDEEDLMILLVMAGLA